MSSFFSELRRRNVIRVGIAYVIVAWLILQVVDVVGPVLDLADSAAKLILFLLAIGLPVAVVLAWAYELTPEGLKKEKQVDRSQSITTQTGRKLDFIIIGVLAAAVIFFTIDKFVWVERAQVPTGVSDSKKSIAVLPFANRSALAEDIFFVDGVHDDILSQLSRIGSLKVISRTSVERFRDTEKSMQEIGQALGASSILEGAVQRAGDRVRINVQLIDTGTDEHLWADTYDRELTAANIFAIQSEIATAIAEELRTTLSPDEQEGLAKVPTESLPALEAYFLGRERMGKGASGPLAEAEQYFRRAIELDPEFALAYVGLADTYFLHTIHTGLPKDEMIAKAEVAVNKALELDDRLSEAHSTLGLLRYSYDPESAMTAFTRALELNPNNAAAHRLYSSVLRDRGRLEDGLVHSKIAVELDPLSHIMNHSLAWTYLELGWYEKAMEQFKRNIALDPEFPWAYDGIGSIYRRVYGRLDKAVPWYEKVVEVDPGNANALVWLGLLVLDLGDIEKAEYWIDRAREIAPDGFDTHLAMHILHMNRGEDEQATDYAEKVLNAIPREWSGRVAAAYLRDKDLDDGRYLEARERYAMAFPELLDEDKPNIESSNYGSAINLALVLSETGEQERANMLLNSSLVFLEKIERLGYQGFWVADVQAYALQGKKAKALAALREAIDSGWRSLWWYYLERDKNMDSIRNEPEYQAMLEEVRTDMAAQLVRLHEAQASGDMVLPQ